MSAYSGHSTAVLDISNLLPMWGKAVCSWIRASTLYLRDLTSMDSGDHGWRFTTERCRKSDDTLNYRSQYSILCIKVCVLLTLYHYLLLNILLLMKYYQHIFNKVPHTNNMKRHSLSNHVSTNHNHINQQIPNFTNQFPIRQAG